MVTVYSKPNCPQCNATKTSLKRHNIEFIEIDISKDANAYAKVAELGFKSVPVVEAGTKVWNGFQPDLIASL